jgi:uncharacterized protein (TIGR02569 family)
VIPETVLSAFDVYSPPKALEGGSMGDTYLADGLVLKKCWPDAVGERETAWIQGICDSIQQEGFRVPAPVRSKAGTWLVEGWAASRFISGAHDLKRIEDALPASRAFHRALAGVAKPDFLEERMDAWSVADRMAWGEAPLDGHEAFLEPLRRLEKLRKPSSLPYQVIHGDMLGNILYHEGMAPGIIDFSPYWRPVEYSLAIMLADAVDWNGVDPSVLDSAKDIPDFWQMLLRAEMFRIGAYAGHQKDGYDQLGNLKNHETTVDMICRELES